MGHQTIINPRERREKLTDICLQQYLKILSNSNSILLLSASNCLNMPPATS